MNFSTEFELLTGNRPFPWQVALYKRFVGDDLDGIPASCNLPTGLGKTSVVAIWLLALARRPDLMPRRLVYVVNRRTVVDQTTDEAEKYRTALRDKPELSEICDRLAELCALPLQIKDRKPVSPLALSTLRGQFADNREWSADPARPAVIVGTVDMIGSRLLFSGYGIGFKTKPLHAGFLGQDVLLVHDEAHLEPAFQYLLNAIEDEQARCKEFAKFRVMELSATSRDLEAFSLTAADRAEPEVQKRINATKPIAFHPIHNETSQLADRLVELALIHKDSKLAILIFARNVETVTTVVAGLHKAKQDVQQLTGTMRGFERNQLVHQSIFRRFLPHAEVGEKTAFLVCTSAGEVGVNISADHLVCDLSTFESMAQRFGRVNRFGDRNNSRIEIVHPANFDDDEIDDRRSKTLDLLKSLNGNGSPAALAELDLVARRAAFSPQPKFLDTSEMLFDAWALTTIRDKLPGRPPVEPYLHGVSDWELPQTTVAWRDEVRVLNGISGIDHERTAAELLEDFPLKALETLTDRSDRVFNALKKLSAPRETPVWIVDEQDEVSITSLGEVIDGDKEILNSMTVVLPPDAGGLEKGLLSPSSKFANDVANQWLDENGNIRRDRTWEVEQKPAKMRLIRTIDTKPDVDEDDDAEQSTGHRFWYWYVRPSSADDDGSKTSIEPIKWQDHTDDVVANAVRIANKLIEKAHEFHTALVVAAKYHDLGKKRIVWQRSIGHPLPKNPKPDDWLAKSGGKMKPRELTDFRHEFGSLLDLQMEIEFCDLAVNRNLQDLILHLIATHHGYGRPHFPEARAFDPEPPKGVNVDEIATEVPRRYARLQQKYGRWGLAYLESLLRAADWATSAAPSPLPEVTR